MGQSLPDLGNVLDNLDIGISIIDAKGTYLFVNKTLLEYTGRSRKDYIGHTVYDFIHDGIYDESAADKVYHTKQVVTQLHTSVSASGGKTDAPDIGLSHFQRPRRGRLCHRGADRYQ